MKPAWLALTLGAAIALPVAARQPSQPQQAQQPSKPAEPPATPPSQDKPPSSDDSVNIQRADTYSDGGVTVKMLKGRHFKDVRAIQAFNIDERVPDSFQVHFGSENKAIRAFVADVPITGSHREANKHRHYTEAILFLLRSPGYSVVNSGMDDPYKFDWRSGDVWSPPLNWIHDHYAYEKGSRFLAVLNEPAITAFMPFRIQRTLNKEEKPGNYVRPLPYKPSETSFGPAPKGSRFPFAWRGMIIRDLPKIKLEPWAGGGTAALLNISEVRTLEAMVGGLKNGEQTVLERPLCETYVHILSGKGYSWIWREGEEKIKYEWGAGDLLAIPFGAWYQHVSTQDDSRYYAVSNRPMMEALMDPGFVVKDNPK